MLAVIHWKLNNTSGNGSPIDSDAAREWVSIMNNKYGANTHWLEWC
jgi:hypothetical protein